MVNLLSSHVIGGVGLLQVGMAMASSAAPMRPSLPTPMMKKSPCTDTGNRASAGRAVAFATRQSSGVIKRRVNFGSQPRFVPLQRQVGGNNLMYVGNDESEILTPETYADSSSEYNQVKNIITNCASEAFDSTDFAHEPHLSPELEDAEAAFEVALLANAAHELVDAAEKENRQSKAAMLERERELEWIEQHGDIEIENNMIASGGVETMKNEVHAEAFQRSLLAAQLANDNVNVGSNRYAMNSQEAFQRSLLSARIGYDAKVKEAVVEAEENDMVEQQLDAVPAVAASVVADIAERMILGEDIALDMAFIDHSPESSMQLLSGNENPKKQEEETMAVQEGVELEDEYVPVPINDHDQVAISDDDVSTVDQWRKDYIKEIKSHVEKKAVEQTQGRMAQRNGDLGIDATNPTNTADTASSKELTVGDNSSENSSILKRSPRGGFLRRVREQKRLLGVALAVVIGRRIFLACCGKALCVL